METTDTGRPLSRFRLRFSRRRRGWNRLRCAPAPPPASPPGRGTGIARNRSCARARGFERRRGSRSSGSGDSTSTALARDRVREREPRRVEELPAEPRSGHAVHRVADDRQLDRRRGARGSGASAPSRGARGGARARRAARSTSKCVTASRGESVSSEWRRRSCAVAPDRRLDPPRRERGRPPTSARYVRSSARSRTSCLQPPVRLLRPRHDEQARRCRGRGGGRSRAVPGRRPRCRAEQAVTSVPPSCPAPGWTTSPAGLSTTSRCSSS